MNSKLYVGGGCFWCTEAYFQQLLGVTSVVSGYSGGNIVNPTYKEVCSGLTGHAELVEIGYDSDLITEEDLLSVFFLTHNPTTLNRQGNDVGTQYRSVIFHESLEDKERYSTFLKEKAIDFWSDHIVTSLEPLDVFYPAEDYHQDYYKRNPNQGYCSFVITPKLSKLRAKFGHLLKE